MSDAKTTVHRDPAFEARVVRQAMMEWASSEAPIDRVLGETFREHKVGSAQRPLIAKVVYDLIRFLPLHVDLPAKPQNPEWSRALDERIRTLIAKPFDGLTSHAAANPSFEKDPLKHFGRVHGVPDFMLAEMAPAAKAWHLYLHQSFEEAPLTIRLNPLKGKADELIKRFEPMGIKPCAWVPGAFTFDRRWPIHLDEAYLAGLYEIQDEHSQLVALAADPKPGEQVLDLCAGAGGKTLHLAELMRGKGEVVAYDISKRKLTEIVTRARRAGLTNVRVSETLPNKQNFDVVLVDAPCSGLGTLRRSPDRLYRFSATEAKRLASIQVGLLQSARSFLKPGGRLVYATCTVRPEENILALRKGLAGSPLKGGDLRGVLRRALGAAADGFLAAVAATPAARIAPEGDFLAGSWIQLGPSSQTSGGLSGDGFFISLVH